MNAQYEHRNPRPSKSITSSANTATRMRVNPATSVLQESLPANATASSAATAPAKPPPSNACSICCSPPPARFAFSGLDPRKDEVAVKARVAYVPDSVAFYPWMTVRDTLDYLASFRQKWNRDTERELLGQFRLDASKKTSALSKGQKTQLALIGAVCPGPDLLILDEPTSGLDPIVRREFIQTVIGAYQEADPNRSVFVSTHLITEFEGLIDEFTIIDNGREVLALEADEARSRYKKIRARFAGALPAFDFPEAKHVRRDGRELELTVNGGSDKVLSRLEALKPESVTTETLTLEEIFVAALQ